jgi:hypothetical protein
MVMLVGFRMVGEGGLGSFVALRMMATSEAGTTATTNSNSNGNGRNKYRGSSLRSE